MSVGPHTIPGTGDTAVNKNEVPSYMALIYWQRKAGKKRTNDGRGGVCVNWDTEIDMYTTVHRTES